MKYLGSINNPKDLVTKEFVESIIPNQINYINEELTLTANSSLLSIPAAITSLENYSTRFLLYHNGVLVNNDSYTINTTTNTLTLDYTAKSGDVFEFIGNDYANTITFQTYYSGNNEPNSSLGEDGDLYLRTEGV